MEIDVAADVDRVWEVTQTPALHERWDLRFNRIEYLPRTDGEPQQFLYSTRLGFGLEVKGKGESVAQRDKLGISTSALKFWSDDPRSLILEGSGYWQYKQLPGRVRFATGYDYQTRFGILGRLFDRVAFRPLIGWATAWSFDTMRLWVEKDLPPEVARQRAAIHMISRLALAFVWVYQGIVPKLLFPGTGELDTLNRAHLPWLTAAAWVGVVGWSEIIYGLLFLVLWRARGLLTLQIAVLALLTVGALLNSPRLFIEPFNLVTLNVALIGLAAAALLADHDLPTARNCFRKRSTSEN